MAASNWLAVSMAKQIDKSIVNNTINIEANWKNRKIYMRLIGNIVAGWIAGL